MERFVLSLLFCSAEMSAVALVYMLLLRLLKNRQSAVLRYYSWLVIIAGFLMPFKPDFGGAVVTVSQTSPLPANTEAVTSAPTVSVYGIVFLLWLAGAAGFILVSILRHRAFRRSIRRLSVPADDFILSLAEQTAASLGISARVKVLTTGEIASPMMTGLLAPTVLLPDRSFGAVELRLILKHELTHFRHRDLWFKLLVMLCRAVHWFNPVMIAIGRSIDIECEHYCDQSVISGEGQEQKKLYCQSILNTVSGQSARQSRGLRPVMATNFYTPKQGLKHRLGLILSGSRKHRYVLVGVIVLALTAVSGSVIAFAGSEPEESAPQLPQEQRLVETTTTTVSQPRPPEDYEQDMAVETTTVTGRRLAETTVKGQVYETDTALWLTTSALLYDDPPENTVTTVTAVTDDDDYVLTTAKYEQ